MIKAAFARVLRQLADRIEGPPDGQIGCAEPNGGTDCQSGHYKLPGIPVIGSRASPPGHLVVLLNRLSSHYRTLPLGSPRRTAILSAIEKLNLAINANFVAGLEVRPDHQRKLQDSCFKHFASALESMHAGGYFDYAAVRQR